MALFTNKHNPRIDRVRLAAQTVAISNRGSYTSEIGGCKTVELRKIESGKHYTSDDLDSLVAKYQSLLSTSDAVVCRYRVLNESTVFTVERPEFKDKVVGVLNFASAHTPGGGFLGGAMAQEEALAYASTLYKTIEDNDFYKAQAKIKGSNYLDDMILSDVEFFRNDRNYLIVNPKMAKVITSAAVNLSFAVKAQKNKAPEIMKKRMRKVLALFAESGSKVLVLGAFGCGVFGNDASIIATIWKKLLVEEGWGSLFEEVVFSVFEPQVLENGNLSKFKRVFV